MQVAFLRIIEEPLGHRMLQRAHVLAPQPVVRHPLLLFVVFGPSNVAHMADVHVHPRELDLSHHAPAVDGVGHGVEQAVAEAGVFNDACLVLAQAVVALGCGKPAPDGGGEQVARDLFTREVLYVVGLQLGFGVFQPDLEGVELFGADAIAAAACQTVWLAQGKNQDLMQPSCGKARQKQSIRAREEKLTRFYIRDLKLCRMAYYKKTALIINFPTNKKQNHEYYKYNYIECNISQHVFVKKFY